MHDMLHSMDETLRATSEDLSCPHTALFNPKMSILSQERHHNTENLKTETSGDSRTVFLYCRDVLDMAVCTLIRQDKQASGY